MPTLNTVKSTWGFVVSLMRKYTGFPPRGDRIQDIYNYVAIDDRIGTSGQPSAAQFHSIQKDGFGTVINLLPHDSENSLNDEPQLVEHLGMDYVYIPVNFKRPSEQDFEQFKASMESASDKKVWIHCAANMRVSAFLYRYRIEQGEDPENARSALEKIWEPFGVWRQFLASVL